MRMGLREANQHFSKAIKAVKAGSEVVLTERGKPIAVIKPIPRVRGRDPILTQALERLIAAGLVRPATKLGPMRRWRPVRLKGEPLSETIRREREER
jgi:prevent-host-death family protein